MPVAKVQRRLDFLRRPSLRIRLTLWTVLVGMVIQLMLGAVVFFYQRRTLDQIFASRLANRGQMVASGLARLGREPGVEDLERLVGEAMFDPSTEGYVLAVYRPGGEPVVWISVGGGPPTLEGLGYPGVLGDEATYTGRVPFAGLLDRGDEDTVARVLVKRLGPERLVLVAATTDAPFEQLMRLMTRLFMLVLPVGVLGTGIAAWLISGLALRPLRELREMTRTLFPETIRQDVGFRSTSGELAAFQQDLADARARLQLAFRAQDRLIANLSHELKTPIAVLLVEASTLDAQRLPNDAKEFVASVQQEMRRLGKLLETFMVLSKAQGGQRIMGGRRCDVNDIVVEAVGLLGASAGERGVQTRTMLSEETEPPVVEGDPELLRQLVEHLIRGAIAASKTGQSVLVAVEATPDRCRVYVRDGGPALPEAAVGTVFDWFTVSSSSCDDRRTPGLAVAKGIAELHGGRVSVHNLPEGGCEFAVEIPLATGKTPVGR